MATKIQDIKSANWQLSVLGPGQIAEGIDDIRQCIQVILTTARGSDPLRPLFGSDIWKFIDSPINNAAANISAEIIDCIGKWEQRIIIKKLIYDIDYSTINFTMTIQLLESSETTEILFYIDAQNQIDPATVGRAFSEGFNFGFN